jgi:hypothetical protein
MEDAVICQSCSLVAHSTCKISAPPNCDLQAQLYRYSQYVARANLVDPVDPAKGINMSIEHWPPPDTSPIKPPARPTSFKEAFKSILTTKRSKGS